MTGFPITFNLYANNEAEVEDARAAIVEFINQHAKEGRAVSATKVAKAIRSWQSNSFVRSKIIDFFK